MMRGTLALCVLCQAGFSCAASECSDSLGSCKVPKASLMQLRALNLNQRQQLQTQFSSQLAAFQKFTDELVAKYGGEDNSSDPFKDPQILQAVQTVLEFIEAMYKSLVTYHDNDVDSASNCGGSKPSELCEVEQLGTDVEANITGYNATAMSKHSDFLSCMTHRSSACQYESERCKMYDDYRTQEADEKDCSANQKVLINGMEPQYLPDCFKFLDGTQQSGETNRLTFGEVFGDEYINADVGSDNLKAMEQCLEKTNVWLNGNNPPDIIGETLGLLATESSIERKHMLSQTPECDADDFKNKSDGLYPLYINCDRNRDQCKDLHEQCSNNQTHFEDAYCYYQESFDGHCGAWQKCWEHKRDECNDNTCPTINNNVVGRKADNETGERLKCLLQVLFGEWNGTAFVQAKSVDNTTNATFFQDRKNGTGRRSALDACTSANYTEALKFWDIPCSVGAAVVPTICSHDCPADVGSPHFKGEYYLAEGLKATNPLKGYELHTDQDGVDKEIFHSVSVCNSFTFQHQFTEGPCSAS